MPNFNITTGIPFGVIAMQNIDPDVADTLWYGSQATDVSWLAAIKELRAELEREADEIEDGAEEDDLDAVWEAACFRDREDFIETHLEERAEDLYIDEPCIEGEYDGVDYGISWLGGAPLLWVFESPHVGRFTPCSPCVPGSGDLDSIDPDGIECYDVPPDWRREE